MALEAIDGSIYETSAINNQSRSTTRCAVEQGIASPASQDTRDRLHDVRFFFHVTARHSLVIFWPPALSSGLEKNDHHSMLIPMTQYGLDDLAMN